MTTDKAPPRLGRPGRSALVAMMILTTCGCEAMQRGALRAYLALNQNLTAADGAVRYQSDAHEFLAESVAEGFEFPWDIHFIGASELLLTEKPGRLWRLNIATGERHAIAAVPDSAMHGQGGLLGVTAHPRFTDNRLIYLSYSITTGRGEWTTRLARARLDDDRLSDLQVLFTAAPATRSGNHFGGALIFDVEEKLYLSVGDRGNRHAAQQLDSHLGKIFRFNADGSTPADNPLVARDGADARIWSYGHRNPQGLAIDPATGVMWSAEHGPQGGDEINRIAPGKNYGWPVITYGEEYGGGRIGESAHPDMEQPVHHYVPSIATAGLLYYNGDRFPRWRNSVFVAGLRSTGLSRVPIVEGRAAGDERLLEDLSMRMRAVKMGPDGLIYVVTENGILLRLRPVVAPGT